MKKNHNQAESGKEPADEGWIYETDAGKDMRVNVNGSKENLRAGAVNRQQV